MRRRSTRTKSSPEKQPDSPSSKSRQRSKRHSASRSLSEEREDKKVVKNETEKSQNTSERDNKKEDRQKKKISLIRSESSSEKQDSHHHRRNSSKFENDERRNRRSQRTNSNKGDQEESPKREETEDEEKGLKGKSKSKTKSKSDKTRQSESESHTHSEISENAQVTAQSPYTTSHNPVSVVISSNEVNKEFVDDKGNELDHCDINDEASKKNTASDGEINETENGSSKDNTEKEHVLKNSSDETITTLSNSTKEPDDEHTSDENAIRIQEKESSRSLVESENGQKDPHLNEQIQDKRHLKEASEESDSSKQEECKNITDTEQSFEKDSEGEISFNKDTTLDITDSCKMEVEEIVDQNRQIQDMKSELLSIFQTPNQTAKTVRKRKWGNSMAGLDLMKKSLSKINVDTIKTFCPNVEFLEETEVKLEVKERRKSLPTPEQKENKLERKVSVDFRSDGEHSRFERRTSTNSTDEHTEPETDNSHIIAMNRKISIVDDTASKLRPPPSPAKNPVSAVLYITNLVRPFTLKQLKDLLERTGKIREDGFWTDRVKSKCYVYYTTEEEAEATRNALHGVNWPVGNAKKLCIEYATPEDLENARNPPPAPVSLTPPEPPVKILDKENEILPKYIKEEEEKVGRSRERVRNNVREWDTGKETRKRSYSREREVHERRRHRRSATPIDYIKRKQRKEEEEIPQKRMDDLFRKTKASPSIYWLPLTPEEIAVKEQQRLQRMAEHKRRMEESSRNRVEYGRGAAYRRRY